jgi:hypothetical protein
MSSPMPQVRNNQSMSAFRRAIELWPYLFIAVSVTGLAYIALAAR